ncbi:hypothetical protein NDU88_001316 [Pleurodeles waltl]|uniref:Secreted protein n=1 Tax=Pleurodeles waltl TaxID=8319 RepID=A0AAV7WNY7_PLEWA|nr:hypothetical protein NDU88_001316 [Pleurodeles waltl]
MSSCSCAVRGSILVFSSVPDGAVVSFGVPVVSGSPSCSPGSESRVPFLPVFTRKFLRIGSCPEDFRFRQLRTSGALGYGVSDASVSPSHPP